MSDEDAPQLKSEIKKSKMAEKQREKCVRAGGDSDDEAKKLFAGVETNGEVIFDVRHELK